MSWAYTSICLPTRASSHGLKKQTNRKCGPRFYFIVYRTNLYIILCQGQRSQTFSIFMRKEIKLLAMFLMFAMGTPALVSCGGDDDDATPTSPHVELSVTPTNISLTSSQGATATFAITASGSWSISNDAEWINISSRSGVGNTTITVTTLSENKSAKERSTDITITSGELSQTITVKQLPAYESVGINVSDLVVLYNSMAMEITFSSNVSYFYMANLSKSKATDTDDEIVNYITNNFTRLKPDPESPVYGLDGLSSNTDYYICAIAFDANGNRGELIKIPYKTPAYTTNRPSVDYGSSVSYSNSEWRWSTTIGPYASRYYMVALSGLGALAYFIQPYAVTAYIIQQKVKDNELNAIVQNGSWTRSRNSSDNYFFSAAWAQGSNNNWSCALDTFYGDLTSSSANHESKSPADGKLRNFSKKKLLENVVLISE